MAAGSSSSSSGMFSIPDELEEHLDELSKKSMEFANDLSEKLDTRYNCCGFDFGWDPILGIAPIVGDAVAVFISGSLVLRSMVLGMPKCTLFHMGYNVASDMILGACPLLGDVFDVMFKANVKNKNVMHDYLAKHGGAPNAKEGAEEKEPKCCPCGCC